jgi:hypothetical protein
MVLRSGRGPNQAMSARNPYQRVDRSRREQVSPSWARWVTTFRNFFVQSIHEEEEAGQGPSVVFYVPKSYNAVKFAIDFTALSPDELDAVEGLLQSCIDLARPIVLMRDGKAKENAANGDDSNSRVYRPVSRVVVRPWARDLDGQGLLDRPKGFLPGDAGVLVTDHRSGDYGSIVAQPDAEADTGIEPAGGGSQDDQPSIDLAP